MRTHWSVGSFPSLFLGLLLALSSNAVLADTAAAITAPLTQYFAKRGGTTLKAIIYRPADWKPRQMRPAVVIFNGVGWQSGEPEWSESYALHYQSKGIIAICAQHRLSGGSVTPIDAIADARDAIRWVRANAVALSVDPNKIAAHGLSVGGHLAASAALFTGNSSTSPRPNALILYSPALELEKDAKFLELLGPKASLATGSLTSLVREGLPPTIILQGDNDTITPFAGAKLFCDKMVEAGNRCELNRYMYVGHRFTPKGTPEFPNPKPDPRVEEAALVKVDAFLKSLGWIQN